MKLTDNLAIQQIIGGLMKNTLLLLKYIDIVPEDFEKNIPRISYVAIRNLFKQGAKTLTVIEVENEILKNEGAAAAEYRSNGGLEFLKVCYEIAEVDNFDLYYKRFKKFSLLRHLQKSHYDISYYYKPDNEVLPLEEIELQERLDEASLEDILNTVESKYNEIRKNFLIGKHQNGEVAEGIDELLEELKNHPDNGPMLEGDIFSYVTRGAREGKFYIKSAASSAGKSRTGVFDACRLAYPIRYSFEKGTFIEEITNEWKPVNPRKVLFIVTEMEKSELQTIILAYLSGVNEEHILRNNFEIGEEDRVKFAAEIMKKYKDYFLIEEISDPNLTNIESTIKKYATIDKVKYVIYDYIHTTTGLMGQFAKTGLREDVALMLMSNQLKQLAKDYNIFIFSATQVNASGMIDDGEFKDATSVRGSKAVIDKADVAFVMTKITPKMWDNFIGNFKKYSHSGLINSDYLDIEEKRPTHILDVYKNRRGRLKDVRIWTQLNLGTGERKDLFITNIANYPISIPEDTLFTTHTQILNDWRTMLKEGINIE